MPIQRTPPLWAACDESNGENGLEIEFSSEGDEVIRLRHLSATTTSIVLLKVQFFVDDELDLSWWVGKDSPLNNNVSVPFTFEPGNTIKMTMESPGAGFDAAINMAGTLEPIAI